MSLRTVSDTPAPIRMRVVPPTKREHHGSSMKLAIASVGAARPMAFAHANLLGCAPYNE